MRARGAVSSVATRSAGARLTSTSAERTRVLEGKTGDYVVVARQERGGDDWYLGNLFAIFAPSREKMWQFCGAFA